MTLPTGNTVLKCVTPLNSVGADLAQRVHCRVVIKHSPVSTHKHPSLASTKYNNFKDAF